MFAIGMKVDFYILYSVHVYLSLSEHSVNTYKVNQPVGCKSVALQRINIFINDVYCN
jgi:hypothetical protein